MASTITNFAHLQIPLENVLKATNNFHDGNIIGNGGFGPVYTGQLLRSGKLMKIFALRLDRSKGEGDIEFWTQISMLSDLKHTNIASIVGFCDERDEKIIVTTHVAKGSLQKHLNSPNLTWTQRLKISIGVARALGYLHHDERRGYGVIHLNINSSTILLDENWSAKLSGFKVSKKQALNRMDGVILSKPVGTLGYVDPEIEETRGVTYKSDIYSFGVVLFEILCGRKAYIHNEANRFLVPLVKYHYENKTVKDIIQPDLWNQISSESLRIYSDAAYSCLKERAHRPNMKYIVAELENALKLQLRSENFNNNKDNPKIPVEDIKLATQNFNDHNYIGGGGFGKVYKGKLLDGEGSKTIVAKRLDTRYGQGEQQFLSELQILLEYKHENVTGLVGYCDEKDEKIIVYEYASRGSLDKCLNDYSLSWMKRLNICIDIASALDFLHGGAGKQAKVIHRDIKTANILLNNDWKAKLSDFGLSLISPIIQEIDYVIDHACGTLGYLDPLYKKSGFLTIESDIYSFGVVLFEILCGRSTFAIQQHEGHNLQDFIRNKFEEGKQDEVVFEHISEQIAPKSLTTFQEIAYQCLHHEREKRPTTKEVLAKLKRALEFQLDDPLQIRLEDIVSATNNFADENLIKEGGFGQDYKGKMLKSGQLIDICARRLKQKNEQGDIEFRTEISILSSLEHKNIISLIGFCDEADEKILIYEYAVHGSLDQHLSDPNLTWSLRLKICLGVARAISFIHYDVIHCDINSSKILLDEDWEPKIFGFELSTKYPQDWRHRLLLSHHFDNPIMTPNYDVYCFGVLLFEVLYWMKPMKTQHRIEPDDIINATLLAQMDRQALTPFTTIIDDCLNEHPVQRPAMDHVVKELEDVFELQWKHENLVFFKEQPTADEDDGSSLNILKIPLSEIRMATNDFDKEYFIASGGYGSVYKAELDVLDIQNLSSIDVERSKIRRTRRTVAIKCFNYGQDEVGEQGFLTEIELLTSCKHPNIISLLGFCVEAHKKILVYEYATKGSLSDYFGSICKTVNLTWAKRIQICLDIAHGINYLHTNMEGKPRILHRDIKSENILLDENLNAKVGDFGLSKFHLANQLPSTINTEHIVGTDFYVDPEYLISSKYKKESDIYSFGVVLFEMLSGRLAYDPIFTRENGKGLAPFARRLFNNGTLKKIIDIKMIEEDGEHIVTLNRGPNQESFKTFSRIAYQCLAETQAKRPTMEVVIKELHSALNLQGETVVLTRFRLSDILKATKKFSDIYCIGWHSYGKVYKAELDDFDNKTSLPFKIKNESEWPKIRVSVAIKRISSRVDVKRRFFSEIEMRTSYKHPNIVSLLGFCDEGDDIILIYEHASNKTLDEYLKYVDNIDNLTWSQRLHRCLGIARGLDHLDTKMGSHSHGVIRSGNILLGKNLEPKIAYFGISKFHLGNQESSALINTKVYWDPEFEKTRIMKKEYDIYSFGVILFEIFCGRLAYDPIYISKNEKGLPPIARSHVNDGTIKKLLDHKLKEVNDDDIFTSNRRPNQDSLDKFLKIAYQCLEGAQAKRPTMEIIIKELQMALDFQENHIKILELSHKDIELATDDFNQNNYIGSGRYWDAYKGEIQLANANAAIVAKRWDSKFDDQFRTELDILSKRKHKNIIHLVGYCDEMNENIIVYEHMSKGSLDKYLKDSKLRWIKRLQICIDVASALEFLHGGDVTLTKVVHRGIKSHGILLNDNWDAKVSNFELSSLDSSLQDMEHVNNDPYLDPQHKQGFLTEKSDIYSLGVILFEILCGRLPWVEGRPDNSQTLGPLAKHYYEQEKLGEIVFEDIKEHIVPQSLNTFADIGYQCLHEDGYKRPKASEVVIQLKKALEFQEDSEVWEPKLPREYEEIMQLSQTPQIYKKKEIYEKLSKGILLSKEKLWFVLSDNGAANKMISATAAMFSCKSQESHMFRSIHISRFRKVAKMLDISNLKIQVTIDNQFLSPDVIYGVYLVFKFCAPRKHSYKRMYMNLKYRNGTETLHSYFATWRDNDWMMIELYRFLNHKEDVSFTFLLESFSRYYCTSGAIYIEGIEFRAIKKVAREDIKNLKEVHQVQKSNSNRDHLPQLQAINEKLFLRELNGKKHLMLSAMEVLYNSNKSKPFRFNSYGNSRFQNVVELLSQQVFRITYKIETQMLSPFIEYACYLVFSIPENCRGLHCPVKVQDLLYRKSKERRIIYFRSSTPWNQHDAFSVPTQREDGWMEVIVWKFDSKYNKFGKINIPMNLKLVTYEGTMSGLVICGLEFRPT